MTKEDAYSLILPNCQPSDSQEEKLQSCHMPRKSEDGTQSSSSTDESEQATGILMVTMTESSDDYQTPPEHNQETEIVEGETTAMVDDTYERMAKRMVDITKDADNLEFLENNDTALKDDNNNDTPVVDMEVEYTVEKTIAHKVFVEMPVREQEVTKEVNKTGDVYPKGKRRLPGSLYGNDGIEKEKKHGNCVFVDTMSRALKILKGEEKSDDGDYDFLETAKRRGLTFPRPRWWPPEAGFEDEPQTVNSK
ncbi:hypothetical protein LXL04_010534 [Taraxacum kok-saghyz]